MTAFFDLDRTVLDVNSGRLWIRSEVRLGYLSRGQAARAAFHLARYHLGFARIEAVIREAVATLEGTPEAELAARTEAFYHREVASRVRAGAPAALAAHRARGEPCVLLTTSSTYLSRLVQADLGFDDSLCNRFEVRPDGRFTGAPQEPLWRSVRDESGSLRFEAVAPDAPAVAVLGARACDVAALALQVATGVCLAHFYAASTSSAWGSVSSWARTTARRRRTR